MNRRLFLGYKIPRKIIDTILMARTTLGDKQKFYNWVSGNNLHLTLLFLGSIDQIDNDKLFDDINSVISEYNDFSISINGTGTFGNENQILWLGIDRGRDKLQKINYELQVQLAKTLKQPTKTKFIPHITIARKKKTEIGNNIDVKNFMNSVYFPIEFHIKFFTLFESRNINGRVHYKRINKFNLI